jgi:glycosyltransferase involved in cell wall biosynthesis
VVVSSEGGAAEIVRRDETGVFFDSPTVEALGAAMDHLLALGDRFDPVRLRQEARRFDRAVFQRRFLDAIARAEIARGGASGEGTRPANNPRLKPPSLKPRRLKVA